MAEVSRRVVWDLCKMRANIFSMDDLFLKKEMFSFCGLFFLINFAEEIILFIFIEFIIDPRALALGFSFVKNDRNPAQSCFTFL